MRILEINGHPYSKTPYKIAAFDAKHQRYQDAQVVITKDNCINGRAWVTNVNYPNVNYRYQFSILVKPITTTTTKPTTTTTTKP